MRYFLFAFPLLLSSVLGLIAEDRPNLVLITADDLGMHLGSYGDDTVPTPNLDRLAEEGVRFSKAYVTQASCSPSRASMLTGLYPHQNGQVGLANEYAMRDDVQTLPALLSAEGYFTGIIGKLHVRPDTPENFPFDTRHITSAVDSNRVRDVAEAAGNHIRESGDKPFFLMVNYFDPHKVPGTPTGFARQVDGIPAEPLKAGDAQPFAFFPVAPTEEYNAKIADYYNSVARLDVGVGLLMDTLRTSGELENTLVVFVSDHGAPFTRSKTTCYESGVHVPMFAVWPGRILDNQPVHELVSIIDILPTFLSAAGVEVLASLPGVDLMPWLEGDATGPVREFVFTKYTAHRLEHRYPRRAVSDGRYKLIHNVEAPAPNPLRHLGNGLIQGLSKGTQEPVAQAVYERLLNPPEYELYDLDEDPAELVNLADSPAKAVVKKRLQRALEELWVHADLSRLEPK